MAGSLIIVIVAALAMGPELFTGLTVTDNFRLNLIWPDQFVELVRTGHLYPRWLPHSWGGMGSPVFYFYPPLFFWVTSLIDTITGGTLNSERLVPLASLLLLVGSGLSMRAWLRTSSTDRRALFGSVGYVLAPYHLYDLYGRGALAEASAYASVPLVMFALARLGEGRDRFIPVIAIAYALLLFSHLPIALLVTLFLIAPYVLLLAVRSPSPGRFIGSALAGGLLGIALSAIFVLPALTLLRHVSPSALTGSFYRPENWFFWHVQAGIMGGRMLLIVPISFAAFLFAAGTWLAVRTDQTRRDRSFWAVLTMFLVVLIAGLIPFVWKLPGLALVQFPWRALSLVEFTTVTLLVIGEPPIGAPLILGGAATLTFAYLTLGLIAEHTVARTWSGSRQAAAAVRSNYWGAPEYLPAGMRILEGEGPDVIPVDIPKIPLAIAQSSKARISASEAADGGMTVLVDSPEPTRIALRRFYFPHWQLHDDSGRPVDILEDSNHQIVTFRASQGRTSFRLEPGRAPYEALGRSLSLAALLILGFSTASMLRPSRR